MSPLGGLGGLGGCLMRLTPFDRTLALKSLNQNQKNPSITNALNNIPSYILTRCAFLWGFSFFGETGDMGRREWSQRPKT